MKLENITIIGNKLAFYEKGSSRKAVVFLHGNSLCCETFSYQFDILSEHGYQCYGIDYPGHGKSEKAKNPSKDYTYNSLRSICIEFIQQIEADEIILVGHSLGGHFAMDAIGCTNTIKGIAVFGSPPLSGLSTMADAFIMSPEFQLSFKENLSDSEAHILAQAYLSKNSLHTAGLASILLDCDSEFRKYYGPSLQNAEVKDEKKQLASLPEICLIQGQQERMVSLEYMQKSAEELGTELNIIEGTAHCPQIENPEDLNAILLDYFKKL